MAEEWNWNFPDLFTENEIRSIRSLMNPMRDAISDSDSLFTQYEMDREFVDEFSEAIFECDYQKMSDLAQVYSRENKNHLQVYFMEGTKIKEILVSSVDFHCYIWEYITPEEYNKNEVRSFLTALHIPSELRYEIKWSMEWEVKKIFESFLMKEKESVL